MAVSHSVFPFATPYDPSKDPGTSVDPLGTTSLSERLADHLLPGFTARMWRPRFLTFSAVASSVAARVADLMGQEDVFDTARLTFERLYVSSLVRCAPYDAELAKQRRIPGTDLARDALRDNEPLTRANFIKGQSINGPTGVMARLARNLRIVDSEHHLGTMGQELILAWSRDQRLDGVLESGADGGEGAKWLSQIAKTTRDAVKREWPGKQSSVWDELTARLRPDKMGKQERKLIHRLLATDSAGLRGRVLELIVAAVDTYNDDVDSGRSVVERSVLQDGVRSLLKTDQVDRALAVLLATIEAYEQCSSLLLGAFDTVRWALSSRGTLTSEEVLADKTVRTNFERIRKLLSKELSRLDEAIERVVDQVAIDRQVVPALRQIREDAATACRSSESLLSTILDRHCRVQKERRKGDWIERGPRLTLMPGFGFVGSPETYSRLYLHPFRITNAYAMLGELGVVKVGQDDED